MKVVLFRILCPMPPVDQTAKSIFKMVCAAVSFGVMATLVKFVCQSLSSVEVVFFRSLFGSIAIGAMIWKEGASWIGRNPNILVLRGVFGFASLSLHFYAISKLDLGTAVMLNYTAPIFVLIFARIMLREPMTWRANAAVLSSFAGLYFLAGPQLEIKLVPILLGLLSGIFAALAYVMIRFKGEEESPYTIIFYFTAISTIGSLPLLKFGFHWPNGIEWIGIAGVTAGAFFGQVWMTRSIQSAPVSFVLPFSYLTPVIAAVAGACLWKEPLDLQAVAGGIIIIASGIAIYLVREKPPFIPLEE